MEDNMKKLLALSLVIIMLLGAFTSCRKTIVIDEYPSDENTENSDTAIPTEKATDATTDTENGNSQENEGTTTPEDTNNNPETPPEKLPEENPEPEPEPEPKQYTRIEKTVYFGSYPQREVVDTDLKSTLFSKVGKTPTESNPNGWTSYGYYSNGNTIESFMWYIDIENGSDKYRGVYFSKYRPNSTNAAFVADPSQHSNQYKNKYYTNTIYWFKYEPIEWTIVKENTTNGTALLICNTVLDVQAYNNASNSNNYLYSTVRAWLNEVFYKTAFDTLQREIILTTAVDNSAASTNIQNNPYASANTDDKVFLPSYADAINAEYGFNSNTDRMKKASPYARSQGLYNPGETSAYLDYGWWWTRSPDTYAPTASDAAFRAQGIGANGAKGSPCAVHTTNRGIVPMLQIKL